MIRIWSNSIIFTKRNLYKMYYYLIIFLLLSSFSQFTPQKHVNTPCTVMIQLINVSKNKKQTHQISSPWYSINVPLLNSLIAMSMTLFLSKVNPLLFVSLIKRLSLLIPEVHAQMMTIAYLEVAIVEYAKTLMLESLAILMKIVL